LDFFKPGGFGEALQKITGGPSHQKKQRKLIQHFWACIGNSAELEYTIMENNILYTKKTVLTSGDVLFVDQKAAEFSYRVLSVKENSKPADLCIRDGSLIVNFDKN